VPLLNAEFERLRNKWGPGFKPCGDEENASMQLRISTPFFSAAVTLYYRDEEWRFVINAGGRCGPNAIFGGKGECFSKQGAAIAAYCKFSEHMARYFSKQNLRTAMTN